MTEKKLEELEHLVPQNVPSSGTGLKVFAKAFLMALVEIILLDSSFPMKHWSR
ncbi:unnamed protein product [Citrullus colocynthis]|uniref:Uncharacterized protein n=1 Tax=Citrullus colocynthis TaxID=252529 RepID=A0ABP0XZU8_9ROSI